MNNELTVDQIIGGFALITIYAKKGMVEEDLVDFTYVLLREVLKDRGITDKEEIINMVAWAAAGLDDEMMKSALNVIDQIPNPLNN